MAQIGFTHKSEHIYDRFEKMRRAYEDKHGRTYAPGFLTVLMDAWEEREVVLLHKNVGQYLSNMAYDETALYEYTPWLSLDIKSAMRFKSTEKAIQYLESSEQDVKEWDVVDFLTAKPVTLQAYAANAEANDPQYLEPENNPVIIKDRVNRYLSNATVATANLFLTNYRPEAKVFDSRDQATAFLRQCGREVGDWIIEPVN